MLMTGKNITQAGDKLHPIEVSYFYQALVQPSSEIAEKIQQLRALKTMQPHAYRRAKTMLPYVVCGKFQPAVRRRENFVCTQHFILDADRLSARELTTSGLKQILQNDPHILLMFTSPGNDGLKILFQLLHPLHDAVYFSAFYKTFASHFARRYHLEGIIDTVTCDVSRACFLSHDPEAFYNPAALPLDAAQFLNPHNINAIAEAENLWKEVEEEAKALQGANPQTQQDTTNDANDLPPDVLLQIKARIHPRLAALQQQKAQRSSIQPPELVAILEQMKEYLAAEGLQLLEAKPIDYGRQLKIGLEQQWCEINLFYGKRGFKVVKTTKTGSYAPLANVAAEVLEIFIATLHSIP